METKNNSIIGKILYTVLFIIILPVLLVLWAIAMEPIIPFNINPSQLPGTIIIALGAIIMVSGMWALYQWGKGLPMSPYPPEKFVTRGIYHLIAHPIYTGASLVSVGVSIYFGSASGLFFISPLLIMSCVAFVLGYEGPRLKERFPNLDYQPLISIPKATEKSPTLGNILSFYILFILSWLTVFFLIQYFGNAYRFIFPSPNVDTYFPVFEFSGYLFAGTFFLLIISPFFAKTQTDLRRYIIDHLVASAIGFYVFLLIPFTISTAGAIPNEFVNQILQFVGITPLGWALLVTFQVVWACLFFSLLVHTYSGTKFIWWISGIVFALSSLTLGNSSVIYVMPGILFFIMAVVRNSFWHGIQHVAESIANSWHEWNFGHIRIINHGFYGGMATLVGVLMMAIFIGTNYIPSILVVAVSSMVVAALWAQFIEGSKQLLRPLGYYGGVIGVIIGSILATILFGSDFFLVWAAAALAAPWIQGTGRLRCLVQGCCHGSITTESKGIRYFHPRSRVIRLAHWKGEYLYPTPVYSILSNAVYGVILIKFWMMNAPLTFIIGMSLIFNSLSRFVEESYRGEPQTVIVGGLRLYQWIAMTGFVIGAILTTFPYNISHVEIYFSPQILIFAVIGGILGTFLTGIDFPMSNKRFSRLV